MDFKLEQFMWVDPKLSLELQAEVTENLLRVSQGAAQNFVGEKRREMADGFLEVLEPDRRKKLEEQISTLHSIKDEARFKTQLLLLLVEAFYGGVVLGRDLREPESESPNASAS